MPKKWLGDDYLDHRKYCYFADIHNDAVVWRCEPTFEIPVTLEGGESLQRQCQQQNRSMHQNLPKIKRSHGKVYVSDGSKGPVYAQIKCICVYRAFKMEDGAFEAEVCWLFIRRREDVETRFSVGNTLEDVKDSELCKAFLMRWPIGQCLNEMKDLLGMDHVEASSWKVWHRHMLLVFIAYEFLLDIHLLVTDQDKSPYYSKTDPNARRYFSST